MINESKFAKVIRGSYERFRGSGNPYRNYLALANPDCMPRYALDWYRSGDLVLGDMWKLNART